MKKKYFGTDGIRGTVNNGNINGEKFFKFGLAAGTYFKNLKKKKQVAIIAKDTRLSGYTLEPALVSGLASAGMHIFTLGPLPTNGLAMLTKKMKANLGIMITASLPELKFTSGFRLNPIISEAPYPTPLFVRLIDVISPRTIGCMTASYVFPAIDDIPTFPIICAEIGG